MNIKGLRVFSSVMTNGTLSAAAMALNASESALSRQLSMLEAELGMTLFHRDKRRLTPTEEGQVFFREAERILVSIEQIPQIVQEIKAAPRIRARIVVMPRTGYSLAIPALGRYLKEEPEAQISIESLPRRYLESWIVSHPSDVGLSALPATHSLIETETICSAPAVALVHPSHPLATRGSVTPGDLVEHTLIELHPGTLQRTQVEEIFARAGVAFLPQIQVSAISVACELVAQGVGVTVTDAMAPQEYGGSVRMVPIEPRYELEFGFVSARGAERTAAGERLAELIREEAERFTRKMEATFPV